VLSAFTVNSESSDFADTAAVVRPDTFPVTVVDVAAVTELAVTPANKAATVNTVARKPALERIRTTYKTS
jgi:hypothetical protein